VIAFTSERRGDEDIYIMNADGTGVRQLTDHPARDGWPTWSPDGGRIAFMSERHGRWNTFLMDVGTGEASVELMVETGINWEPAWSPDGTWIAFGSARTGESELYLWDVSSGEVLRLTDNDVVDGYPSWSPDGAQIAFGTDRDGNWEIYVMNVDGTDARNLTNHEGDDIDAHWSPDGEQIVFTSNRDGNMEIYIMNADGGGQRRLTDTEVDEINPDWSPDGAWIAFSREVDGNEDVYLISLDGSDQRRLTRSSSDDSGPVWRPDVSSFPDESGADTQPLEEPIVEEISFQSGDFTLVGDLRLPSLEGQHPVIIMVHGSGDQDRTDFGKYFPIWERFLRAGYGVYSWDKPGTGESRGRLAYDSDVIPQRAAILLDAIEVLKLHSGVDTERIGVWGISQGGYVMPLATTLTDDIAFMIVVSGPAMDSYDQGAFLVGQLVWCAGYPQEDARTIQEQVSAGDKALTYQEYIDNMVPLSENPIIIEMGFPFRVRSEDEWEPEDRSRYGFFNPIDVIEKTTIPVLVFFGEEDRQVDPFQGAAAYQEALQIAGNQHFHVELIPDVDHNLVLSETGCLSERDRRPRADWLNYASVYLDLMEEWLFQLNESMD
jgi:Tol biopolymer transport system component/predicted esterase